MANVKISQLPSLSTMTGTAQIPVVASGTTYQITGANLQNYFVGTYGNANVVANVAALGSNPVSTAGNVTGAYVFGNGSQLTGLPATYGNANVVANLAALGSNPVSTTGNITGGNILTGGLISVVGNITAGNIKTYTGAAAGAVDALFLRSQALTGGGRIVFNNTNGELTDSANLSFSGTQLSITGAISASGNITSGNVNTGIITLTNGAVIKDNAGDSVAFGQSAGGTSQGNSSVALGHNAGATDQGTFAVAIGRNAGQTTQGGGTVAVGVSAGDTSQGNSAVAIGQSAGFTNQSANTVAVGVGAGQSSQGVDAVAIGNGAGSLTQGISAVAIGTLAGRTFQANNSIIINATGANLDQTTANTFTVAPVRNDVANIGQVVFYNTTSKEVTYGNVISVAGNITGGNVNTAGLISVTGNVIGGNVNTGKVANTGNLSLTSGANSWTFDTTGNLTVPGSIILPPNSLITSIGASPAPRLDNFDSVSAVNLSASGNVTSVTVSASGNITGGNILGGANVNATTHTGTTVSVTGNVTGGNANITSTTASTSKTTGALTVGGGIGVAGDLYAGNSVTVDGGAYGNVTTTQFASVFATGSGPNPRSIMQVRGADGAAGIGIQGISGGYGQLYANTGINFTTGSTLRDKDYPTGGTNTAILDSTGLSVTGIVSASGNVTGGNISTGSRVVTTPVAFSTLTAVTGARAFVNDGNLVAATNFGAQVSGGGANTVPVWSDGTNWYIG